MVSAVKEDLSELFSDIRFDEARHLYFINNEPYTSVSKKIEAHYEKFIEDDWLPRCAPKEGVTIEELRSIWHKKNKDACAMGTKVHLFLEEYIKCVETFGFDFIFPPSELLPQEKAGLKFLADFIYNSNGRYEIITQEYRMAHRVFKYCGTTDLLIWDNETETIIIADWKTNLDLFKTYGYLRHPFGHIESNPFNKYQLQLSYYQLMLEQSKYRVSSRWIIYLSIEGTYTLHVGENYTKTLSDHMSGNEIEVVPTEYGIIW